ncbi:Type 1 glutamine amidotransferase-like domain-containing protein [Clostridium intestinale]|uniref:Peptidase n=1 Tax=Clostridium intestinale URNW TaxID=1294142 RepID=U2Q1X7_9CLOT|nr:Type 1 glutamine amidotransferase-like domain-containing protein [Clostridium intestinale]ERK30039.1 peptidase [Clostridium intestinale URNW]
MKLFLTSKAFGNSVIKNKILSQLKKDVGRIRLLLIPTALSGTYPPDKYINELLVSGFSKDNIIIFDETKSNDYCNLEIDIIYVCGGNTFTLVKLINECGFALEIVKYLSRGVMYMGRSAGTHLVTRNVEHVLPFDENKIGLDNFDALGLFDGIIFCHYDEGREEYYSQAIKKEKYNVYKITNEEMIIYDNGKISIL